MIRNYIRAKKAEWKIKATVYGTIAAIIDNQKELLSMIQKLYMALKDIPTEELEKEFISKLAEIVHKGNTEQGN
jgi:metal-responsive CopG/Arc/MetJ family transcriptional regulator